MENYILEQLKNILNFVLERFIKTYQEDRLAKNFQEPAGCLKKFSSSRGPGQNFVAQDSCEEFKPIKTKLAAGFSLGMYKGIWGSLLGTIWHLG